MAFLSQQLERFLLHHHYSNSPFKTRPNFLLSTSRPKYHCPSTIAIDTPSSLTDVPAIRWGSTTLQGPRDEMEDQILIRSDHALHGFSFAAVFDGHAGFSTVQFLRDELYKECVAALKGGLLLSKHDFNAVRDALIGAFQNTDFKLLNWLQTTNEEDESGSTATVMLIGTEMLILSHLGDSSAVLSRSGKAEELTSSHRPYGNNKVSLQEIRRIREAGGWFTITPILFENRSMEREVRLAYYQLYYRLPAQIVDGRICGDISVSRAFGDIRFKTKKDEMLKKGVEEGRWSQKFISRVKLSGDLIVASPDVLQVALGSDVEFVLLASDGLWDYMKSSEAITFVRNQLQQHGDAQLASEALAQAVLDRRSQDNVSIIIADLGRTDWQNLPLPQQNLNFVFELTQALATIGIVSVGIWMTSWLSL